MSYRGFVDEGFKNPDDIFDQPSWREIAADLEAEDFNVRFIGDESKLTDKDKKTLKHLIGFLTSLSKGWQAEMIDCLKKNSNSRRQISENIMSFLKDRKLERPDFKIYPPNQNIKSSAVENGELRTESDEFFVIFELPKPLAFFWFKGLRGSNSVEVNGTAIEWGAIYWALMPLIWRAIDNSEKKNGLFFFRVNDYGYHKPGDFYYVWLIKKYESE